MKTTAYPKRIARMWAEAVADRNEGGRWMWWNALKAEVLSRCWWWV